MNRYASLLKITDCVQNTDNVPLVVNKEFTGI